MYQGATSTMSSMATHMAINQQKPGKMSRRLWRKVMSLWVTELMLWKPLGKLYKYGNELDCQ
eukprot:5734098-Ditylum_brightwellii.AAC.1